MDNTYELVHYGVPGMKWGVHRYRNEDGSLTAAGKKRIAKGQKKQARIVKKQDKLRNDNEYRKNYIKETNVKKRAIESEKLSTTYEKQALDRRIAINDFWTKRGMRKAQDKSLHMNTRLKQLEEMDLKARSDIASALERMDLNNKSISKLDKKYIKIGKKYLDI